MESLLFTFAPPTRIESGFGILPMNAIPRDLEAADFPDQGSLDLMTLSPGDWLG